MKRLLILCAGLTSLVALSAVRADTPDGAATTGVNHVFITNEQHSSFTVKDYGPDSVDRGNVSYQNFTTGESYNADVACVYVFNGNQARFAFQVPAGPNSGLWRVYAVKDGGEPGTNGDELGLVYTGNQTAACSEVNNPTTFPIAPSETITAGNVQVRDY